MARVLLFENREKTLFWAAIARQLQRQGHEIAWIVQNPFFALDLPGRQHRIPFPRTADLDPHSDPADFPALSTDRGREHFEAGSAHYGYYTREIARIFDCERPDIAVGESTLFHELIAIDLCAQRGIPFAHPVGERYPSERFDVFDGMTQCTLVESGEMLDPAYALDYATRIAEGRARPGYMMAAPQGNWFQRLARRVAMKGRVVVGRLAGERYNTPSPRRKMELNRLVEANLRRWRAGQSVPADPARTILYPLQMQPENTIDVWGRPDCDQLEIVRRLLSIAPDVQVAVKANPKPYYELSTRLLDFCLSEPRVTLLPVEMTMVEALKATTGAVTVTGTVGYEAVCGRGRCISTAHPLLDAHFPEFAAPSIEAAGLRLLTDPDAGRGSPEQGARLLQRVTARSFDGLISDPLSDPRCMTPENIAKIARGVGLAIDALTDAGRA